jgi:hypothetical protein
VRLVLAGDRPGNVTVDVDCQQAENSQRRNADGHRPPRAGRGADRRGEVGREARDPGCGPTRSQRAIRTAADPRSTTARERGGSRRRRHAHMRCGDGTVV